MADLVNIQPLLPSAPEDYSRQHQNEIQRSIDVLYGMMQNPGEIRASSVTITHQQTGSGAGLSITKDIRFTEQADHSATPGAGYGYLWTKNTAPSTLVFTDDAGTDTTISTGTGDVTKVGTPANNEIGVWTGDGTIEGETDLTYDETALGIAKDIRFTEQADHSSTPGAGFGYLWTKSTTPSTLIFTDDTGTDMVIGSVTKVGTPVVEEVAVWTGDGTVQGANNFKYSTGFGLQISDDIRMLEQADHSHTPAAGAGYIWVKNTVPTTLVFTDDTGVDTTISTGTGDVTKVGTPANNEIGVWTGDGTLEGETDLTYDETALGIAKDIRFTEQADHSSTPGAGFGYLWVKSTAPSTLIFTDDTGADTLISSVAETSGSNTVTLTATTGTLTLSSSFDTLSWVQQGTVVNLGGWLKCTAISSPTGTITLNNIPTCSNLTEGGGTRRVDISCTEMNPAMTGTLTGLITEGGTTMEIWNQTGGSLISAAILFSNTSELFITVSYVTSD